MPKTNTIPEQMMQDKGTHNSRVCSGRPPGEQKVSRKGPPADKIGQNSKNSGQRTQFGAHVLASRVRIARQAVNSHLRRKFDQFHLKQGF